MVIRKNVKLAGQRRDCVGTEREAVPTAELLTYGTEDINFVPSEPETPSFLLCTLAAIRGFRELVHFIYALGRLPPT